ncbi:MAG: hypothetical protein ABW104_19825 [Candidatus Thiodiazotropha sp. 6PLUC2]
MILCRIDGSSIEAHELTFSQLSFGKEGGSVNFNYEIIFAKDSFIEKLIPFYDEGVEELREDDGITGEFEPPYPGATNYPSLSDFLDIENRFLYEYLYAYHKFDILSLVLSEDNNESGYIINTLESIDSADENIVIKGVALKRERY